jgi:hypothetical protein
MIRKGTATIADGLKIDAPRQFFSFLRSLASLFGPDCVLYLEGGGTPPSVKSFLQEHKANENGRLPGGTLLPTPDVFHVSITPETMDGLASLLESEQEEGLPTHLHVYDSSGIALQWYDASAGDSILVRASLDGAKLAEFCETIGSSPPHRR